MKPSTAIQKTEIEKPDDWPCNRLEQAVDRINRALDEFATNPNYKTREVLVSLASSFDFNQLKAIGRHRISPYEIASLNSIWFSARLFNLSSPLMFVYRVVSEHCLLDRCLERLAANDIEPIKQGIIEEWKSYRFLHTPLQMFYLAFDDYRDQKEGGFDESLTSVCNRYFSNQMESTARFEFVRSFVVLLSDLSNMLGSKWEEMLKLSREQLHRLFAFEFELLRQSGQDSGSRPLKGQLMIQISNFILKSRHGYNEDFIYKFMPKNDLFQALSNQQVWIRDVRHLNDKEEGVVFRKLFADVSWLGYDWATANASTDSRKYYVACFSKSRNNREIEQRYGSCILGYKGDRIIDLIAPIEERTMYRSPGADPQLPESKIAINQTQVIAFDVLYDEDEAKEEIKYLCSIINMLALPNGEKNSFLQEILEYWRYSVKSPDWAPEKERRYVLFTYPDVIYHDAIIDENWFKFKSLLFTFPDFVLGDAIGMNEFRIRADEKRRAISMSDYFFCHTCLNRDFDLVRKHPIACTICGSHDYEVVQINHSPNRNISQHDCNPQQHSSRSSLV